MLKGVFISGFLQFRFGACSFTISSLASRSWLSEPLSSSVEKMKCPQFRWLMGMENHTAVMFLEDKMLLSCDEESLDQTLEVKRMAKSLCNEIVTKTDGNDCLNRRSLTVDPQVETKDGLGKCQDEGVGGREFKCLRFGSRGDELPQLNRSADVARVRPRNENKTGNVSEPPSHLTMERSCKQDKERTPRTDICCTSRPAFSNLAKKQSRRPPKVYEINRLISFFMETGYQDEAYAIFEQMGSEGCKPNSVTYFHLIKGLCEAGKFSEALQFFKGIFSEKDISCSSNVVVYNAMIHGLGAAGFVDEALRLLEDMTQRGCFPDLCTYNSIIYSLGKAERAHESLAVFESMTGKGYIPDVITYNSLIFSLGKAGRAMDAYKLYERMIERFCLPDIITFNTLLSILGKSGEVTQALKLFSFMISIGCQPNVYTYTTLVATLCWAGRVDEALVLSVVMTEKGCAPNTVTFNSWLDGLCKGGRLTEANLLFQKMVLLGYVPDTVTYSILIDASCNEGFVDISFQLLKKLLKSTNALGPKDFTIVFQSFKKMGMLKQAKRIVRNARAKQ